MESGKNTQKDTEIVADVLKELGIKDYEDNVLDEMLKFTNKYVSSTIDNAMVFSNPTKTKKKFHANDVARAISHHQPKNFINTPDKELIASMAKHKNSLPLPQIKSSAVSQLPPDHDSPTACNYRVKSLTKKARTVSPLSGLPTNSGYTWSNNFIVQHFFIILNASIS
ncbi:hypothetical protein TNIN_277812 [Trichonephila inaurata madagascariensis]|uniref:Transcription initiation factor TFIID subunit 9 n=1 Tax=Trichonephila inaurata madagascariensis TaxID=2747483 RepID=A0A8X6XTK9_9ARAC|nr:hypothetical protein TNIN_277812 [Trichonephila inaurata madagascariensis]